MSLAIAWKLGLAAVLLVGIVLSARARAPRRAIASGDLHRLIFGAVVLYGTGTLAWLTHHVALATVVYAAGIATAALAAWLSRGEDSSGPPGGGEPADEHPPPDPGGLGFDWVAFERDLRDYTERARDPAGTSG